MKYAAKIVVQNSPPDFDRPALSAELPRYLRWRVVARIGTPTSMTVG